MTFPKKISFLHIMIAIALLSFITRFSNIVVTENRQNSPILQAQAVEESQETPPPMKAQDVKPSGEEPAAAEEKPTEAPRDFSDSEVELLQALSQRREELDKREKKLQGREALLQAAEQQVDRKIAELKSLRTDIEKLLGQQSKEEQERIESLVKIYESMKPKEAAAIFNTLEMDVLLSVLSHMSERRSAPIIAAMTPDKAREITIKLSEQKQLPALPTETPEEAGH